jgi:hypothetical protein
MSFVNDFAQCGGGHTVFWVPVLGPDGEPYDKESFPPHVIESLKTIPDVWGSQYLLQRPGEHDSIFDEQEIVESMFEWVDPMRTVMRYKAFEFDPDNLDELGQSIPERVTATVSLSDCRFYMHVDAKHKLESQARQRGKGQRPSKAAILITAVAPDHHVFIVDWWLEAVGLEGLARKMFSYYCLWAPYRISWESVGAQFWLREYFTKIEDYDERYRYPTARTRYGMAGEIPKLSSRMVEAEKTNQSKEFIARVVLSGLINRGVIHLDSKRHDEMLHQLLNVLDDREGIDLVDCLGQGPGVWKAPPPPSMFDQVARRLAFVSAFAQPRTGFIRGMRQPAGGDKRTGFKRPWS